MKKALTIGLAATAFAASLTLVAAGTVKRTPVTDADALPAYEIIAAVRAMGFSPTGEPVRRGPYYVLHAYDPNGKVMRMVADAYFGEILSVAAVSTAYTPSYQRGPRIIHVPRPGDRQERASERASERVDERVNRRAHIRHRDEPDFTANNDDDIAPSPRRRVKPKSAPHVRTIEWPTGRTDAALPADADAEPPVNADAAPPTHTEPAPRTRAAPRVKLRSYAPPPPPSGPRRAVLSAPPPSALGPPPVSMTPSVDARDEPADKSGAPAVAPDASNATSSLSDGPTPVRPTSDFDAKADRAKRFASPIDPATAKSVPPPGYLPPGDFLSVDPAQAN